VDLVGVKHKVVGAYDLFGVRGDQMMAGTSSLSNFGPSEVHHLCPNIIVSFI
jgi:hypothetical protein